MTTHYYHNCREVRFATGLLANFPGQMNSDLIEADYQYVTTEQNQVSIMIQ